MEFSTFFNPTMKLVIFDLDGVLVDAPEIHRVALNKALNDFGYPGISDEDHKNKYNGLPTKKKLKELGIEDRFIQQIYDHKQKITIYEINNQVQLDMNKVNMCHNIKQNGIKLACVSNCSRETGELMLKRVGILGYFDYCLFNEDMKPKPSSDGYIKAMVKLNSFPEETLILEDSPHGIQGARNSCAKVLEITSVTQVNWNFIQPELF